MSTFNQLGDIRRSQVVTTYGPGSIIDFRAGRGGDAAISVVASGLESWERVPEDIKRATTIYEPRLQKVLDVRHFRLAPVAPQKPMWAKGNERPRVYLEGRRFPQWQQCPKCNTIGNYKRWSENPGDPSLKCPKHGSEDVYVVPVRFVTTCRNGHLDEFPWSWWVHMGQECSNPDLVLRSEGGTGLASLVLSCKTCKKSRNMDGALSRTALEGLRCKGRRPWLDDAEECDQHPIAVQRGASNLYFARSYSSLDIPPWSDPVMRMLGPDWEVLTKTEDATRGVVLEALNNAHQYTTRLGMSVEEILDAIQTRTEMLEDLQTDALLREEHLRLLEATPDEERGTGHEFETEVHPLPERLSQHTSRLVEVRKLREVRAITGFTRVSPPGPDSDGDRTELCKIARDEKDWLPAVEIRGEGIFVELNQSKLQEWRSKNRKELDAITSRLLARHAEAWESSGREGEPPEQPIHVTYLLVHTMAHALIRQLSLDCGYSSASLRERLYVDEDGQSMAGALIYTGSSDADGTLGGLSRQASPDRFSELFVDAIRNLAWCSNDPLCIHGEASSEPLNRAACHSCALVAETSCEAFNQLLDRSVLVGTPQNRKLGFFYDLLQG